MPEITIIQHGEYGADDYYVLAGIDIGTRDHCGTDDEEMILENVVKFGMFGKVLKRYPVLEGVPAIDGGKYNHETDESEYWCIGYEYLSILSNEARMMREEAQTRLETADEYAEKVLHLEAELGECPWGTDDAYPEIVQIGYECD